MAKRIDFEGIRGKVEVSLVKVSRWEGDKVYGSERLEQGSERRWVALMGKCLSERMNWMMERQGLRRGSRMIVSGGAGIFYSNPCQLTNNPYIC